MNFKQIFDLVVDQYLVYYLALYNYRNISQCTVFDLSEVYLRISKRLTLANLRSAPLTIQRLYKHIVVVTLITHAAHIFT